MHRPPGPVWLARAVARASALLLPTLLAPVALGRSDAPSLTHGPLVAEVTDRSAIVWARVDPPGGLRIELWVKGGERSARAFEVAADPEGTARARLRGLASGTIYYYRVRPASRRWEWRRGTAREGRFRTAPAPDQPAPVRIAFGGDLGGQQVCRDAQRGFPIFDVIRQAEPDLFVALGDMIYADAECPAVGRLGNAQVPGEFGKSIDLEGFRAHWRYARSDPALSRLLADVATVAVWDDHEVTNDFGPQHDSRTDPPYTGQPLLPLGLRAFREYNPVQPVDAEAGLYRRFRQGKHVELVLLDTRSRRDANSAPDDAERPKTMLGLEQRYWLERVLRESSATWKLVVSSVPISIPTGSDGAAGRDGWADGGGPTGFERELIGILRSLEASGVRNLVFLSTDVHFASVLRYVPFADRPDFQVEEFITGPLQAGIFPRDELDPSLRPERLFAFPIGIPPIDSFEGALGVFNFGLIEVDAFGGLRLRIVNARGETLFGEALSPR